jgi:hypothetical protein
MIRPLATALLVLCAATAARAGDGKPNTLTPQEAADGVLLLFDGKTTFGWKVDGEAAVENGTLVLGGTKATTAQPTTGWGSFDFTAELRSEGKKEARFVMVRTSGGNKIEYGTPLDEAGPNAATDWDLLSLDAKLDVAGQMENYRLAYKSTNGNTAGGGGSSGANVVALAALKFEVPAGQKLVLRNVKLKPLGTKSIYNGKDLTGWKEFPGKKSVFGVNDKGELNVKNGPGDLQTEAKYGDFVLQLQCISNGKHLNSGVFFRCKPNEYQNGYEAQIHNGFGPEKDVVVEKYDPETHKLIAKEKVKTTAIDFGTGAIYRRVPARLQASKDGEWFTMTVVAHGKHIATWVNGIQVVDWYDHRLASDNPRNGYRQEAGHISLQGHDPTTDLSFRNFRIAELPPGGN